MEWGGWVSGDRLRAYCQHHVCVDEDRHIPMAKALLLRICGDSAWAWQEAAAAATSMLVARQLLAKASLHPHLFQSRFVVC